MRQVQNNTAKNNVVDLGPSNGNAQQLDRFKWVTPVLDNKMELANSLFCAKGMESSTTTCWSKKSVSAPIKVKTTPRKNDWKDTAFKQLQLLRGKVANRERKVWACEIFGKVLCPSFCA
jgi:hypothetical protein